MVHVVVREVTAALCGRRSTTKVVSITVVEGRGGRIYAGSMGHKDRRIIRLVEFFVTLTYLN